MGSAVKVVDVILFSYMLIIALACVLIYSQLLLPQALYPHFLVQLKNWYIREYDHYLMVDQPYFYVGLVWYEFTFEVPLILLNLYAILTAKPWLKTTCLIYGVALSSAMVALLSEMVGSGRASAKLLSLYGPVMGLGVLAILRGLGVLSGKSPKMSTKKRL
ncbi:sigma intracellular receptor 2-like [Neltuma alba]|uniref:sigma intracellular receptor 2-like n=1 Tax=Neltuma alba TaxID=207710 RepID=UPI0010A3DFA5|nr:sigma intracellular receptor 2-like [Prosopis alba]